MTKQKGFTQKGVEKMVRSGSVFVGEQLDGRGNGSLYLRVRSGKAEWLYQFFLEGKKHRMTLGTVELRADKSDPAKKRFSLSDARTEAGSMGQFVQQGIDPRKALKVRRAEEQREHKEAERQLEAETKLRTTFTQFWNEQFLPTRERLKKRTVDSNAAQFRHWIEPEIGGMRLVDLSPIALERICSNMRKAGQSPKSQKHAMGLVSAMWTLAKDEGFVVGDSPTRKIKIKIENRRVRFLSEDQADELLAELLKVSKDTHDLALMGLRTGARFGELAKLRWSDVNLDSGLAHFKDTKNGDSRHIPLTLDVISMLQGRDKGFAGDLVFPSRNGDVRDRVSKTFTRTIEKLGFNDGITDSREKISFHSLRHTCASWLVTAGVPLYKVGKLLGHTETKTTERYSHLAPDGFKDVVDVLERTSKGQGQKEGGKVVQMIG